MRNSNFQFSQDYKCSIRRRKFMSFRRLVKRVKRRLSFESWRKEKNLMYRKLLKDAEEKKQQELQKKLKDIECKKASQQVSIFLWKVIQISLNYL